MKVIKQAVGVDVSKGELVACFGSLWDDQQTKYSEKIPFENSPKGIRRLFKWAKQKAAPDASLWFVMEATGVYYEHFAYFLQEQQQLLTVVLPNQTNAYARSLNLKSKTDPIDSRMLAQFGLERELRAWQAPSPTLRALKVYTREYEALQAQKTVLLNQLHAKDYAFDVPQDTKKRMKSILTLLEKQLKEIKRKINDLIDSDPELKEPIYRIAKIKGLGVLTLARVVAETNAFATFENRKQITSYAGYDIVHRESGQSKRKTRISHQGNGHIRLALYWPTIVVVRFNKGFKIFFDRVMTHHTAKMVGYVAVARKLLILIFTLWKNKTEYDPNYQINGLKQLATCV